MEKDSQVNNGKEPKWEKNSGQSYDGEFVKRDIKVGVLKVFNFFIFFRGVLFNLFSLLLVENILVNFYLLFWFFVHYLEFADSFVGVLSSHFILGKIIISESSFLGVR